MKAPTNEPARSDPARPRAPVMAEQVAHPDLLPSLGLLARGLSALFWGLPLGLVVCFNTVRAETLRSMGVAPPLACTGLLVYGLWKLGGFQKQERVWRNALDRARVLSLINFGLSPFLYWWNKVPGNSLFLVMVLLMGFSALLFLASLNLVLQRLGAMLPDETLRLEIKQFTKLNLNLLAVTVLIGLAFLALNHWPKLLLVSPLYGLKALLDQGIFWSLAMLVPLVLLPIALTMALLWKTKEVILENVFGAKPA